MLQVVRKAIWFASEIQKKKNTTSFNIIKKGGEVAEQLRSKAGWGKVSGLVVSPRIRGRIRKAGGKMVSGDLSRGAQNLLDRGSVDNMLRRRSYEKPVELSEETLL